MRIKIVRITTVIMFIIVICELFYIQVIRGRFFYNLSKNNRIRVVPLEGWRGRIFDRNGVLLADTQLAYNVLITPQLVKDVNELFYFLAETLGQNPQKLMDRYRQKKTASFIPVVIAEDIPRERAVILEENKYRFPSLIIQEGFRRVYPLGKNSAHVLGYVGKINRAKAQRVKEYGYTPQTIVGYSGVEEFYNDQLKGGEGGVQIEVNSRGKQVRMLSIKQPVRGEDITITIDSRIQQTAMELLEGKLGVIIVMDMENGEILSMVSSPSYDPNVFADRRNSGQVSGLFSNPSAPLLNRAIKGIYPPGSVFKIPVSIAALNTQKVTDNTTFICPGFLELGGKRFGCTASHGSQDLNDAIAHSCNVYFYSTGRIIGDAVISSYARLLGLGRLTRIDLPYEKSGLIPSQKQRFLARKGGWYLGDTFNLSIGQGDTLTSPLQLVKMMSTVARSGVVVQPHVILTVGDEVIDKYSFEQQVQIDAKIFQKVMRGMRSVVAESLGTANNLYMDDLYVAGKTGTAQAGKDREHHAWFVGYTNGTRQNVAFCVFLEHGGSSHNATALVRELLLKMKEMEIL